MALFVQLGRLNSKYLQSEGTQLLLDDSRTVRHLTKLLALNESGMVTVNGQVGSPPERWRNESDGTTGGTKQRAWLLGLVHESAQPFLDQLMVESELVVRTVQFGEERSSVDSSRVPLTVEWVDGQAGYIVSNDTTMDPRDSPVTEMIGHLPKACKRLIRSREQIFQEEVKLVEAFDPVWDREDALLKGLVGCMRRWQSEVLKRPVSSQVMWNDDRNREFYRYVQGLPRRGGVRDYSTLTEDMKKSGYSAHLARQLRALR